MKEAFKKAGRWLWAIPMVDSEEGAFWERDGGWVCLGARILGVDARFVALGQPGERKDVPLITCTLEQMREAPWWKQWEVETVVLNAWALPRYEPIARAIKVAGIKLILTLDTEGIVSPHVWPWRYLHHKYFAEKDSEKWFRAGLALLKTVVGSFRMRHAGTIRHLEHAEPDCSAFASGEERYSRYLLAMKRADLIGRLRCVPSSVVKEMTHVPAVPKKPLIIAVGRWNTLPKNTPLLLRVLERVLAGQPRYSARIIGGGSEVVKGLAEHLNADCQSPINIVGRVDHKSSPLFTGRARYSFALRALRALLSRLARLCVAVVLVWVVPG